MGIPMKPTAVRSEAPGPKGDPLMAAIDWSSELMIDEGDTTVTIKVPVSAMTSRWVRTFKTALPTNDFRISVTDGSESGTVELRAPSDCTPESLQDSLDGLTQLISEANDAEAAQAAASAGVASAAREWWSRQR
jgi:hypothetical protein